MQTLSVLAVEDGAIIVASPAGERFRLPVDAALRARIAIPPTALDEKRLSPREIQAHVRAGLTAEQVAAMTGVPVASIERFVGPVLAERAYLVESALAVRLPPETEGARSRTFGAVMGERLDALAAKDVRWTSAKEPSGWVLAVAFVADDVQHSARWRFDPKHMALDADNVEASTLSQQGVPAALTPRLRAIEPTAPVTIVPQVPPATQPTALPAPAARSAPPHGARVGPVPPAVPDQGRFDSAVFRFPPLDQAPAGPAQTGQQEPAQRPAAQRPTTQRPTAQEEFRRDSGAQGQPTTDQLAQMQRRRGERHPAPGADPHTDAADGLPITREIDVIDPSEVFAPRPAAERREPGRREPAARRETASVHQLPVRSAPSAPPPPPAEERPTEPLRRRRDRGRPGAFTTLEPRATTPVPEAPTEPTAPAVRPRRGRTSMPSWDEIVFGRDEP